LGTEGRSEFGCLGWQSWRRDSEQQPLTVAALSVAAYYYYYYHKIYLGRSPAARNRVDDPGGLSWSCSCCHGLDLGLIAEAPSTGKDGK